MGSNISGPTLRKLLDVKEFETTQPKANLNLLDKINSGDLSIDRAKKIVLNYYEQQEEVKQIKPIAPVENEFDGERMWKLYHSSSLSMRELLDGIIQVCITSVPYFSVRKYGKGTQLIPELGLETCYKDYLKNMIPFLKEVFRVLSIRGSFFLNIGETYSKHTNNNIMLRLVLAACDEVGFHLVNSIVWHKTNSLPQTTDKRLQPSYEMIYHLVKDVDQYDYYPLKYLDKKQKCKIIAIDRPNKKGGLDIGEPSLSKPYKKFKDFIDAQYFEDIIISSSAGSDSSALRKLDPNIKHFAIFPSNICVLPILTTSKPGQIVLDCFSGSGTTIDTAIMLGRKGIGYETEERFVELTHKRMTEAEKRCNEKDMNIIQEYVESNSINENNQSITNTAA